MPTKSAGRVSIRVVPDSTRFKSDLEKSLERIEKQLKAKIRVELDLNREQLARIKRQIENLKITIRPKIELNVGLEEIFKVKEDIESMRPKVEVELNTKAAATRMAELSRTRVANIFVKITTLGLQNLGQKVGALAGLNVVLDSMREGADFVNNLDRHAIRIARLGTLIAGIGGSAIAAAGGVVTLSQDLAKVANLGILAPAFGIGFATTIAVAVVALKDMKERLKDLGPEFTDLQNRISDGFWGVTEGPMREMIRSVLPGLKEQLTNTGQAVGTVFAAISNAIKKNVTPEYLDRVFDRMNQAIARSSNAMGPFIHAFAVLGDTGSKYFGRFSEWIVKLSKQFDGFISKAAKDGRLDKWINEAIQNTKDLGSSVASIVGILDGVGDAARKAGVGGLKEFKGWLDRIEGVVKSSRFQSSLVTLFEGGKLALDGLLQGIKNLGPGLESIMPTVKTIMGTVGDIFKEIGDIASRVLGNKELQTGLKNFFDSIFAAVKIMGPAVDPMAKSLGGLFDLMAKILPNVATLISQIMVKWGPAFDKIIKAIEPLIPKVVELAGVFIDEMAPILEQVADEILPPLVDLMAELIPWFTALVKVATPILATTLTYIGTGLKGIAEGARLANEKFGPLLEYIGKFAEAMKNFKWKTTGNLIVDIAVKVGWALAITKVGEQAKKFMVDLTIELTRQFKAAPVVFGAWAQIIGGKILKALLVDLPNFWRTEIAPKLQTWAKTLAIEVIRIIMGKPSDADGETKAKADAFGKSVFDNLMLGIQGAWSLFKFRIAEWIKSINPFANIMEQIFGSPNTPTAGAGGGVGSKSVPARILPSMLNESAETTWLNTFKTNMGVKMGTLPPVITGAIGTMATLVGPQWSGFWNGLSTNANTNMTSTAGVVGNRLFGMNRDVGTFKTNALLNIGTWGAETLRTGQNSMGGLATTIAGKLIAAGGSVGSFVADNLPKFMSFFNQSGATATNKLAGMKRDTDSNLGSMASTTKSKGQSMQSDAMSTFLRMASHATSYLRAMVDNIRGQFLNAVSVASTMGGQIVTTMNSNYNSMVSSGSALVAGFAAGMRGNLGIVTSAAFAVAAAVRAAMPHSPAKIGPLSGKGYTTHSGRALVKDLAGGMMDNMHKVRAATKAVAGAASMKAAMDFSSDLDNDGVVIDRRTNVFNVYNPIAEPTSRTLTANSNKLRMAKAL